MSKNFKLHTQLAKDTHLLFETDNFILLLHKNATIPWIIIVPKTKLTEVYELPVSIQESISSLIKHIAKYFESAYQSVKMNIAAIGNLVPQLHIHVIGRKPSDACWPDVVWGNSYKFKEYSDSQIVNLKKHLESVLLISTNGNHSN